jgi:hypothetical protein
MMTSREWIAAIESVLRQFADPEYQRRVWILGLGPEVSSYDEAVNLLLVDLDLAGLIGSEALDGTICKSLLADLEAAVENGPNAISSESDMETEQWKRIVGLAGRARIALQQLLADRNE